MNKFFEKYLPLDKSWHFITGVLIYTMLTLLNCILNYFNYDISSPVKLIIVIVIGFGKEWIWDRKKGGFVDEKDFLYTVIGGVCCFLIDKF